jgi:hypothetical protein
MPGIDKAPDRQHGKPRRTEPPLRGQAAVMVD